MKKPIIYSFFNPPTNVKGLKCKSKSMTMPGQAVTVQEIQRSMTAGALPPQLYYDEDLSSFSKLSIQDRIDYLNDLKERNSALKDNILSKVDNLEKQKRLHAIQQQREALRKEIQEELRKPKNDDQTTK